ncbi:ABC transporter ATP-binding protein [Butyrivibrio sp. TB]|uniref:ABC transporter ATP-binding protein n=1 Tax=Butyrivibrio sp. TB TaxID=1520809 RepID=UPI0008B06FB6|nr:ABC transporter ATP-binding protein [Butyrivibrio sp. TB]SEP86904.1 ABC-type multidrug transport system, ATPase and permease component [Butyrivibrio sp. TB]
MADNKKETSLYKISSVIRVLFGTAARKYPLFFAWESIKTIVSIAQPFIAIMISPLIVDEIVGGRDIKKLIFYAAVLIIGEFVATMLIEKSNSVLGKYQERLECYFDVLLGKQTMELDFQLTEDKEALDQLQKAKTGMSWYSGGVYGVAEQVFMFAGNIFKMAGLATVIILHAPALLLILAVYAVFHFALTTKINKFAVASFNKLSKFNNMFGYFAWEVVDSRYGKDIRLYNAKDIILNAWKDNTKMQIDTWKWQADKELPYDLLLEIAVFAESMFTYFYVALLAIGGAFGIGVFTQLITAEGSLENTLFNLVWNVTELVKRCNYAYEYVVFMDYPAALPKGDKHIEKKDHEIEFRHVSFAYPKTDRKILDDISIKIRSGEHLSIVGLNGAGKTTFIKLLCRLYDPTEGEILVDGVNIKEYDYKEYMQQIAPVFQDFKLFAFSMGENIAFDKASNAKMSKYTDLVGLKNLVKKLDNGFNTNIFKYFDEKGIEPSGGEQQKIAISRALFKESPIVILDEPTAALDPLAEYEVYKEFHTLVGGKTAVYISHRLSSCKFCDKIAVFSDGHIAEYGTHDELINIPSGIYAEMFEAQAKYYRDAS